MKEHFVIIRINRGMLYDLELEDDSEIVSFHKTKDKIDWFVQSWNFATGLIKRRRE